MDNNVVLLIVTALAGMMLLGYGYYGFFMVQPAQAEGADISLACPFGAGKGFFSTQSVFEGAPQPKSCSYSFESLLAGAVVVVILLSSLVKK